MRIASIDPQPVFGGGAPAPGSDDRLRIALGVNDTVIRHLYSIGLGLHTTRTMVSDLAQVRLDGTIGELDLVIGELRSLVFDLQRDAPVDRE